MGTLLEPEHSHRNSVSRERAAYCRQRLPELRLLERLIRKGAGLVRRRILTEVSDGDQQLPLYALELGGAGRARHQRNAERRWLRPDEKSGDKG